MITVIKDYSRALCQLSDPRLWKPVLWATILSLGSIFIVLIIGGTFLFQLADRFTAGLSGWMSWADGWLGGLVAILGTFFIAALGYFFLASVYSAFLGLFLDGALDAVRETHYPYADWIDPPGIIEATISSVKFILWSLLVYLLASPVLLVGYLLPPVGVILQFLLGGYLLSREFGKLIELRLPKERRVKTPGSLIHGIFAMILWMLPVINLFAPILLVVSLVHKRLGSEH
jgi:uncharacterized protein involved in cysteine biosynthesis